MKLLIFRNTKSFLEYFRRSSENICRKFISVPSLDITSQRFYLFEGRGVNNDQAEVDCNLRIIEEMYDFDCVKEASLELYTRNRKVGYTSSEKKII